MRHSLSGYTGPLIAIQRSWYVRGGVLDARAARLVEVTARDGAVWAHFLVLPEAS